MRKIRLMIKNNKNVVWIGISYNQNLSDEFKKSIEQKIKEM